MLRKRFIIETVLDEVKNISQIEHTLHRSLSNCMVSIIAGLIAYTHQPKKPGLDLSSIETKLLPQLLYLSLTQVKLNYWKFLNLFMFIIWSEHGKSPHDIE